MMTILDRPEDLALGYLLNQNMLKRGDAVSGVEYDDELGVVVVRTEARTDFERKLRKKTLTSGCAQGTAFGDLLEDFAEARLPAAAEVRTSWLYRLLHRINTLPTLYLEAGAIHGCALCERDRPLVYMEDVGRHNAVDKIAGWMFRHDTPPGDKMFYTTGRLTSEMVIKTVRMGIPVLISRSGFTAWGVELARQAGLTLIGRCKGRRFLALAGRGAHRVRRRPPLRRGGKRQALAEELARGRGGGAVPMPPRSDTLGAVLAGGLGAAHGRRRQAAAAARREAAAAARARPGGAAGRGRGAEREWRSGALRGIRAAAGGAGRGAGQSGAAGRRARGAGLGGGAAARPALGADGAGRLSLSCRSISRSGCMRRGRRPGVPLACAATGRLGRIRRSGCGRWRCAPNCGRRWWGASARSTAGRRASAARSRRGRRARRTPSSTRTRRRISRRPRPSLLRAPNGVPIG